ncbi:MAG: tetratricopeptide repeat protein [Planctomycetota bacterium]
MKKIFLTIGIVVIVSVLVAVVFSGKTTGYWLYTGNSLHDRPQEALNAFDQALKLDPKNPFAWYLKGSVLLRIGEYDKALKAFDKAQGFWGEDDEYRYEKRNMLTLKCEALNKSGRYLETISLCDELIKDSSDHNSYNWYNYNNHGALSHKAFALGRLQRYEEAIIIYDMMEKNGYRDYESVYNRACIYSLMRRKKEALNDLANAINNNRGYKDRALSDECFQWLCDDEDFKKVTAKTNYEWQEYGRRLSGEGRYAEAIRASEKALELNLSGWDIWDNIGRAYLKLGNYDEAIKAYEKGLECNQNVPLMMYNKACAYSLKRDKENALKDLRKVIPSSPRYWKAYARQDPDFQWLWDDKDFRRITR